MYSLIIGFPLLAIHNCWALLFISQRNGLRHVVFAGDVKGLVIAIVNALHV